MGGRFGFGQARLQGHGTRAGAPIRGNLCGTWIGLLGRVEAEVGLATADKFEIDLGQQFGIEQSAVLFAARVIDAEAAAKRVECGGGAGELPARDHQCVSGATGGQCGQVDRRQLGVQEFHVKTGIVDDQLRVGDEIQKRLPNRLENGLIAQEIIAKAVDVKRVLWHRSLWVDVLVVGFAGRQVVEQLDRAYFDDSIAFGGLKASGFGIKDDLTHGGLGYGRSGI